MTSGEDEENATYECYKQNYYGFPCLDCQMNYMCEGWRKRDGINPVTKGFVNPLDTPFNPRQVA